MPETLNSGDIGTACAKWMDSKTVSAHADKPIACRDALVTHYTATSPIKDFTTLLSMFLRRVAP
jgi:hypothetical protein